MTKNGNTTAKKTRAALVDLNPEQHSIWKKIKPYCKRIGRGREMKEWVIETLALAMEAGFGLRDYIIQVQIYKSVVENIIRLNENVQPVLYRDIRNITPSEISKDGIIKAIEWGINNKKIKAVEYKGKTGYEKYK